MPRGELQYKRLEQRPPSFFSNSFFLNPKNIWFFSDRFHARYPRSPGQRLLSIKVTRWIIIHYILPYLLLPRGHQRIRKLSSNLLHYLHPLPLYRFSTNPGLSRSTIASRCNRTHIYHYISNERHKYILQTCSSIDKQ
jgi:hypothetical protein